MEIIQFDSEGQALQGAFFPGEHVGQKNSISPLAVILCHGAFEGRENWYPYAERLADQGFPTLALDFVGHGHSTGPRGLVELRQWAYNLRDAVNILAERGYNRFALVGWGSGGSAALLAAAHERRLDCVVVLAAPVQMMPPLSERVAYSLALGASRVWKAIKKTPLTLTRLDDYAKMRFANDEQVDAAYKANPVLQENLKAVPVSGSLDSVWVDITTALVKIKAPVLIIHGRQDAVVPIKQSDLLYAILPGHKKLCLIEDSGHALHLDQKKDEVFIAIAKWLKHYSD
jgi:pimeloyl-ACP methyl ester carboxylesterase